MTGIRDLEQARLFIDARRYDRAVRILASRLAANPDDADALCLMAQAQLGLQHNHLAVVAARSAIRIDPDNDWAHRLASIGLTRSRDYVAALDSAAQATRLAPNDWRNHLQLAEIGVSRKRITTETRQATRRVLELAPDNPAAHILLGNVHLVDHQGRAARAAFREALRLDPQSGLARNNMAVTYARRRWPATATAAAHLSAAIRTDPTSTLYTRNLARVALVALTQINLVIGLGALFAVAATSPRTGATHTTLQAITPSAAAAAARNGPTTIVTATNGSLYALTTTHDPSTLPEGRPAVLLICAAITLVLTMVSVARLSRIGTAATMRFIWPLSRRTAPATALVLTAASGLGLLLTAAATGAPEAANLCSAAALCGLAATGAAILAAVITRVSDRRTPTPA